MGLAQLEQPLRPRDALAQCLGSVEGTPKLRGVTRHTHAQQPASPMQFSVCHPGEIERKGDPADTQATADIGGGSRTEVSQVPATEDVRRSNLGRNPLKLRGFHDLSQLLWFERHLVLSADNRISMLTQAKIAPVITFVIKRRLLEEHLVHHTIRVCRFFIAVMAFPQFCFPIPLSNRSGWNTCARWRARKKGRIELHPAHHP